MGKVKATILGSGNIGTDLMIKLTEASSTVEPALIVGIDPDSEGLSLARSRGIATCDLGIEDARSLPEWETSKIVFDATSASAHRKHDEYSRRDGKVIIDLTPAAIGPYCVPVVNSHAHLDEPNVNMVSCGGQATIPMVYAVNRACGSVPYAEIVASVSSRSAGPGTRANIDEFTVTTARGIEKVAGAGFGKAIIILNPAEPPMLMRDTIYALAVGGDEQSIESSVEEMVSEVQTYVPGYRLKQKVQFERFGSNNPVRIPGLGEFEGIKTTIFVEVEGAGHYLPTYAGNLDIMTSAGIGTAERIASRRFGASQ